MTYFCRGIRGATTAEINTREAIVEATHDMLERLIAENDLRQEDIAFTTGIGRRFIVELEAGKPSCQLGKALIVAAAVGLRPFDLMAESNADNALLPDLPEPVDEPSRG